MVTASLTIISCNLETSSSLVRRSAIWRHSVVVKWGNPSLVHFILDTLQLRLKAYKLYQIDESMMPVRAFCSSSPVILVISPLLGQAHAQYRNQALYLLYRAGRSWSFSQHAFWRFSSRSVVCLYCCHSVWTFWSSPNALSALYRPFSLRQSISLVHDALLFISCRFPRYVIGILAVCMRNFVECLFTIRIFLVHYNLGKLWTPALSFYIIIDRNAAGQSILSYF